VRERTAAGEGQAPAGDAVQEAAVGVTSPSSAAGAQPSAQPAAAVADAPPGDADQSANAELAATSEAVQGLNGSPTAQRLRPSKWRRRAKWSAIVFASLAVLVGALVLLVRWSVREHERLMSTSVAAPQGVRRTHLFSSKELPAYRLYRAPAIVRTKRGDLLGFAEARASRSDRGTIALVARRSRDNGATWSGLKVVLRDTVDASYANPAPIVDRTTGTIWLAHRQIRRGKSREIPVERIRLVHSNDEGVSWSDPIELGEAAKQANLGQERYLSPSPGHGLQLQHGKYAGRLLFASYPGRESRSALARGVTGRAYAVYSDDHGKTWHFGKPTDYGGEAHVVEATNGDVLMVIRTRGYRQDNKRKRYAWSRDGGMSWTPTGRFADVPAPVCHGSLLALPKGGFSGRPAILLLQPGGVAKGRWDKSSRKDLTVWMSRDDGLTWPDSRLLHKGGAAYSDLALGSAGYIHAVYEVPAYRSTWSGAVDLASFHRDWIDRHGDEQEDDMPFSEWVYDIYQDVRAPIEEWLKDE
jgi:sialidase-1